MSISGMAAECDLGQAVPNTTASQPSFTNNTTGLPIVNTPPATGIIAPPQSPLNTPTPNTGRSVEATATYMAASLNILNVGTTPPPTGNLQH